MLELSTLLFNSSALPDSADNSKESLITEFVAPFQERENEDELQLDPNSFMLLMAQLIVTPPENKLSTLSVNPALKEEEALEVSDAIFTEADTPTLEKQAVAFIENHKAVMELNTENEVPALKFEVENKAPIDLVQKPVDQVLQAQVLTEVQPFFEDKVLETTNNQYSKELESYDIPAQSPQSMTEETKKAQNAIEIEFQSQELELKAANTPQLKTTNALNSEFNSLENEQKMPEINPSALNIDLKQPRINQAIKELDLEQPNIDTFETKTTTPTSTLKPNLTVDALKSELEPTVQIKPLEVMQTLVSPAFLNTNFVRSNPTDVLPNNSVVNFENPQWATQFTEQIISMGEQGQQRASLKIHPEELGPLEINVKVVNDHASVSITSHNSQVRELLDQSVPRLRDLLAEQGLNLSDFSVASEGKSRQFSEQRQQAEHEVVVPQENNNTAIASKAKASKGLVDYFA